MAVVILLVLACAPAAAAAEAQGTLLVEGTLQTARAHVNAPAQGLYVAGSAAIEALLLRAEVAEVERHEWAVHEAKVLDRTVTHTRDHQVVVYPLRDIVLTLAPGDHSGPLLVRALTAAPTRAEAASITLRPGPPGSLGDSAVQTGSDDPRRPRLPLDEPHVHLQAQGMYNLEGLIEVTLFGPDVQLDARENSTFVETGTAPGAADGLVEKREVALVIRAQGVLEIAAPVELVAASMELATNGTLRASRATGEIESAGVAYHASGDPASLTGDLTLSVAASNASGLRVGVTGDLQASTLAQRVRTPSPAGWSSPWALVLLGAVVSAATAGLVVRARYRRREESPPSPEDWAALAETAIDAAEWELALERLERARQLAPSSARIALERAHVLHQLGRLEESLAAYETLARGGQIDAQFHAIHVLLQMGRSDAARGRLIVLLDAHPIFVLEMDGGRLARLEQDPAVMEAVRRARLRMGS